MRHRRGIEVALAKKAEGGEDEVSVSLLAHRRVRWLLLLCALALPGSAQQPRPLTVYTAEGPRTVAVHDQKGVEYAPLLDVLQQVGSAAGKADGKKFTLRFGDSNCEFRAGKNKAKIRGKNIDLAGAAEIEQGTLLVPVRSLTPILSALLGKAVEYREPGRRLLVAPPIDFVAEMRSNPPRLVLHFSRPVNPKVTTEPGHLRLSFAKDPVVAPQARQTFNDKLIASAAYSESSGAAVLTIAANTPLMATFSDEGRAITIGAAPQTAVEKPAAPALPSPPPQVTVPSAQAPPPAAPAAPARPRYVVVIDPAHGGDDRGAALEAGVSEKDVTLAIARRLRAALDRAGIAAILLRDGDGTMSADQRAIAANTARAAVYVGIHAGSVGRGVRIYTARMSPAASGTATMASWDSAQASYLDRSRELADSIASQLAHASIDHAEDEAQLQPLPHLISPAVVIELLPDRGGIGALLSTDYQQRVCAAIAQGIAAGRRTVEARR